ncbi:MAG: tyrosyl-tRNA synthetase [Actinomycetota bacterium]|nr:tyrosyl-tRNA synthetase [Actinomycetota bacterium]
MSGRRSDDIEWLTRRAQHVVSVEELTARVGEGRPLRVKLGLDPTARDVTLGWAVVLRKLRDFQDAGHTAVLIVGDFTARIGDPSGKSETRPQLSKEEVRANAEACLEQLMDVLSSENLEVRYNSEWLEPMDLADILRLTSRYTVAQMLERDDFQKRYRDQRPISIIEFLYPLAQAYDSVAVRSDVELGGSDQLFNLLVGRDIQRAYDQRPQIALTTPLLEGLDGVQKMSQSLGNYVGIREEPAEMFGKLMSIPDELVGRYGDLATELPADEAARLGEQATAGGPSAASAKRAMARAVVALYHDEDAAQEAEAAFDRQFKQHEIPESIPEAAVPPVAIEDGQVSLPTLLAELALTSSRGEARRLLSQGGVRVDGTPVADERVPLDMVRGRVVQVGRRKFVRIVG